MKKLIVIIISILFIIPHCQAQTEKYESVDTIMQRKYNKQIDDFVIESNKNFTWGNGSFLTIAKPENDKDALIKGGIEVMDIDTRKSKGTPGALILSGKDIVIHNSKYRAVLYEKNKQNIALYKRVEDNKFTFRSYAINDVQGYGYVTKANYELIKKYLLKKGISEDYGFGPTYVFNIKGISISFWDGGDNKSNEYLQISGGEEQAYPFRITLKNGIAKWAYLCLPLVWTTDMEERVLNNNLRTILIEISKN